MRSIVSLIIVLLVFGFSTAFYNMMADSGTEVDSQWQNVRVALTERTVLSNKLAKLLEDKQFPKKEIIQELKESGQAIASTEDKEKLRYENFRLDNAVNSVMLSIDAYPVIKNTYDFGIISKDLIEAERTIDVVRDEYNAMVQLHNQKVKFYPFALFANFFDMKEKEYFRGVARHKSIPEKLYRKDGEEPYVEKKE